MPSYLVDITNTRNTGRSGGNPPEDRIKSLPAGKATWYSPPVEGNRASSSPLRAEANARKELVEKSGKLPGIRIIEKVAKLVVQTKGTELRKGQKGTKNCLLTCNGTADWAPCKAELSEFRSLCCGRRRAMVCEEAALLLLP